MAKSARAPFKIAGLVIGASAVASALAMPGWTTALPLPVAIGAIPSAIALASSGSTVADPVPAASTARA